MIEKIKKEIKNTFYIDEYDMHFEVAKINIDALFYILDKYNNQPDYKKACEDIYDYLIKGFDNANLIWSKQHIIELTRIKKTCRFDNNGVCEALGCFSKEQCSARDTNGNPTYKYNLDKETK